MNVNRSARSGGLLHIYFQFPIDQDMLCVLIRGDSNDYTQNIIFNIKRK